MGVGNVIIEIFQIFHWTMTGVPFWAPQTLSWKRLRSCWTTFIVHFFSICSISWSTKTFSWEVIETSEGEDFWTGTDRKGIWYPFTVFKMEGLLVSFSQFSKKYWKRSACGNFRMWVCFWTENLQILLRRLNLLNSYLRPLLLFACTFSLSDSW